MGNSFFSLAFLAALPDMAYYRIVHYQDPVVHIPPILLGYWHAPTEVSPDSTPWHPFSSYRPG